MFSALGIETDIDLSCLCRMVGELEKILGKKLLRRMKTVLYSGDA